MENERTIDQTVSAQQQHDQAAAAAKIQEVYNAFGEAFTQLEREQQAIRENQNQIIAGHLQLAGLVERLTAQLVTISGNQDKAKEAIDSLGKLLPAMDARVQLLTRLLDMHHDIFIAHGWANPRPAGGSPLAN